jgi:PAS domain S-box-containing protein
LRNPRPTFGLLTAAAVLILGAIVTWLIADATRQAAERLTRRTLQERALRVENRLVERLLACEALLHAGAGFIQSSWPLTAEQWRVFSNSIQRSRIYPGLQGVGFAGVLDRLTTQQVAAIQNELQRNPSDRVADERTAILYLEPRDRRNERAIGFDMMSETVRREAMSRARDRGEAALSGRVTLVQEIDSHVQPGFLMYLPIYREAATLTTVEQRRAALLGFVYSPFRAADFLDAVLPANLDVDVHVYDGPRVDASSALYVHGEHAHEEHVTGRGSALSAARHLTIAGHEWTVLVAATPTLVEQSQRIPVWIILAVGLTGTMMLSGLALAMGLSRQRLHERLIADERLLEQERDAATMLENSLEAFIVINEKDEILEWNKQAEVIFGWQKAEVLGTRLADVIVPQGMRRAHLEAVENFQSRAHTILGRLVEMPALRRDGAEIFVALSVASVLRRQETVFFASVRDVTARRFQEERLRQLTTSLEQRVSERTQALEKANRQLEMTNRDLSAFTRSVSHDLRAPLRAIQGYSGMLGEDLGAEITPKVQRDLDAIAHTARRMEAIIDDLLKLATVGQRDLKLQSVPLSELMARVLEEMDPPQAVTVHVQSDELGAVYVDPGLIMLALRNLLANAIKFSRTQVHPQIWIGCREVSGERVFYIRDNGVGFDPNYTSSLFGAFQRLHSEREFEGTGLGLTIVKSVIEKHRGRVWATSELGQGATFSFVIPEPQQP